MYSWFKLIKIRTRMENNHSNIRDVKLNISPRLFMLDNNSRLPNISPDDQLEPSGPNVTTPTTGIQNNSRQVEPSVMVLENPRSSKR